MPVEIRNSDAQRFFCISFRDRVGERPYTEFVAAQSGLEIRDGGLEQVFLGLVENANMRSLGMPPMTRMPVSRNAELCRGSAEALLPGALALERDTRTSRSRELPTHMRYG